MSQQWLDTVLSWFLRGTGDTAAKGELQRDPMALLCAVSLRVGAKAMPGAETPYLSALNPPHPPLVPHLANCAGSELVPASAGAVPIFCRWAGMEEAPEGLAGEPWGGGLRGCP